MIYAKLEQIRDQLTQHGYQFDSSSNTRILLNDEDIETILCGHSEKLAIAFNLIQHPIPSTIQVTQNLRICRDCRKLFLLLILLFFLFDFRSMGKNGLPT